MFLLQKRGLSCNLISSNPNLFLQTLYQGSPELFEAFVIKQESWQSLSDFAALQRFQIIS